MNSVQPPRQGPLQCCGHVLPSCAPCRLRVRAPRDWLQDALYEMQPSLADCRLMQLLQAAQALVLLQVGREHAP